MSENAKVAIQLTLQGASIVARGLGGVTGGVRAVGAGFATATATAAHFLTIGKDVINMANRMAVGVGKFTNSLIAPNIDYEDATVGFENLLGSADAARERIKALYDYANVTPFMNKDVLDAGIKLQNAGGAALGMGKGLEMVGDMAAYARRDLSEVAEWTARLYQNLQSGDPFLEAARRLQEMNVMTGQEIKSLNELSESGADGTAMWDAFVSIMAKTEGSANKLSTTMSGMKSTVAGMWEEMKRLVGVKLFEAMKADLSILSADMSKLFETGQIDVFAAKFGGVIKDIYDKLKELAIGDLGLGDIMKSGMQGDLLGGLSAGFGAIVHNFWEQMVYMAKQYGPTITKALMPERLHGVLGLNNQEAFQKIAAGDTSAVNDLSKFSRRGLIDHNERFNAYTRGQEIFEDPTIMYAKQQVAWRNQAPDIRSVGDAFRAGSAGMDYESFRKIRVIPTDQETTGTAGGGQGVNAQIDSAGIKTAENMSAAEQSAANVALYMQQAAEAAARSAEINKAASLLGRYSPARF